MRTTLYIVFITYNTRKFARLIVGLVFKTYFFLNGHSFSCLLIVLNRSSLHGASQIGRPQLLQGGTLLYKNEKH